MWYARCGLADRVGPFPTQLEAFEATRKPYGGHYDNAYVWAETVEDAAQRDIPWDERNHLYKQTFEE